MRGIGYSILRISVLLASVSPVALVAAPAVAQPSDVRSFDIPPPPLESDSEYNVVADRRYQGVDVPSTESLKDTIERVLPYWDEAIAPALKAGERVLISAHGNSIRALVKHLSGLGDQEIVGVEIPTGQPLVYELNDDLSLAESYYLSERA